MNIKTLSLHLEDEPPSPTRCETETSEEKASPQSPSTLSEELGEIVELPTLDNELKKDLALFDSLEGLDWMPPWLEATQEEFTYPLFQESLWKYELPGNEAKQTMSSSKVVHAQKIEPLTVSELNQFIIIADSQIIEFLCMARVTGIQQDDGWCYIGFCGCFKKLVRDVSSFTCVTCNETNAVASLRYCVTLSVSNNTDTACFLGVGVDAQVNTALSESLPEHVVKTFTFQLKLNEFNFTSKHQTFTISHIFPERELAPMPAFVMPGRRSLKKCYLHVSLGTDGRDGETRNDGEEPFTSDASIPER
ncbi:OB-fold-like protein [Raphanus sativus]|nr:OB-fold-like protein [Raphanus sativus]